MYVYKSLLYLFLKLKKETELFKYLFRIRRLFLKKIRRVKFKCYFKTFGG